MVAGRATAGKHKGNYQSHAFRTSATGLDDLGTLGGDFSGADSINNSGEIVGWSENTSGQHVPFLYSDEFGMVFLELLITNMPSGAYLHGNGLRINDAGEICGTVIFEPGIGEACLLIPTE